MLYVFQSITPSPKSNMNKSFMITFIKIASSRLLLLKSTLRILISSLENVTIPESLSQKSTLSSANKALWRFLITLLVTNQPETDFNAVGKYRRLYHAFLESYNYHDKFLAKMVLRKKLYHTFLDSSIYHQNILA